MAQFSMNHYVKSYKCDTQYSHRIVMLSMDASSLSVTLFWTGCKLFKMATQEGFYKIRLQVEDLEVT